MCFLWQVNGISIIYCPRDANPIMDVDVFCSRVCKEGIKHNCVSQTGEKRYPHKDAQTSNSEESGHCSKNATSNFSVYLFTACLNFPRTKMQKCRWAGRSKEGQHIQKHSYLEPWNQHRMKKPPLVPWDCGWLEYLYLRSICVTLCT